MAIGALDGDAVKPYPLLEDLGRLGLRVGMPRAPRMIAPGGTMRVVARRNKRECSGPAAEDFDCLLAHLRELIRTYEVPVSAYVPRRGRRIIGTMPSQNQEVSH